MSSLTDRIALILQSEASSDALAEVIDDAQDELEAAQEACAEAQERVLDPLSSSSSVTKAKREADRRDILTELRRAGNEWEVMTSDRPI